jgi:hypothetical protein
MLEPLFTTRALRFFFALKAMDVMYYTLASGRLLLVQKHKNSPEQISMFRDSL